jgi:bifunctional DNA-binding transcriptional regulator/antitoxin component of YhaV-PrlF toxin-antitoxin module
MKRYRRNSLNRLEKYCIKCGEWKDLERDFYNHNGTLDKRQSYCKNCHNNIVQAARYGNHDGRGLVPFERIKPFLTELTHRIGKAETARRLGWGPGQMADAVNGRRKWVRKYNAKKILDLLKEVRANDEVWSRDTIKSGALKRGRTPRRPVDRRDYYKPTGDDEVESRGRARKRQQKEG